MKDEEQPQEALYTLPSNSAKKHRRAQRLQSRTPETQAYVPLFLKVLQSDTNQKQSK